MLQRLPLLLPLFFIVTLGGLSVSSSVWAQENGLEQQLTEISEQVDKQKALDDLSLLLKSKQYKGSDKAKILLKKSKVLFASHRYNQAVDIAMQARALADKNKDLLLVAQINHFLGILFYYQGELKKALKPYQASLAYYVANQANSINKFAIEQANLLNNIALVYTSLGQPNLALANYELAEPLYAKYGTEGDKIDVRYNIAALHISLRRFDSAIDILKVVIQKRQQLNNEHGIATARADIGIAYKHSGQFALAKENILAALSYFEKHDYKHDIASQLHNMSELSNDIFDVEQAIYYGQKALIISDQVGHQKAYAGSLQSLAKAKFYAGDLVQAEQYIQRSTDVGEKIDYQRLITENLAISALINAGNQQFIKALKEQQQYEKKHLLIANNTLNDKLAEFESEQLNQKIVDLEQRQELEKLQSVKIAQQRNVIILTLVLILGVVFYIYRRHLEKRLTKELELRVKQRTRELENLTKELEKADQVKNQFLANMSHEIRTPLTAIVGHAEALIYDDVDKSKVKEDVQVIHGNSLHLLELINDILDLSRIEANKFELETQTLDLGDLIQDLSYTFKAQAQQKNLCFAIEHDLPLPFWIEIDSLRLKQILLNLCNNAIKFTEQGKVTLAIQWQNEQLTFNVIDTGIGLDKAQLSQVFEMFTQADNSISRRFGGSGLGLSLSKQLAKLMSGNIVVTSILGKGSQFCLTLPCQRNVDNSHNAELPVLACANTLFNGSVLLAEDHDDNRRLIARLLANLGLTVLVAKNGKEAVQLCVEHQPDLILLDIQMPEMDGVEAFKALRDLGCNKPIYALTANAMSHEVSRYLGLGFTGHLKKPIERKKFVAAIAQCFNANKDIADTAECVAAEEKLAEVDLTDLIAEFTVNLSKDKQDILRCIDNNDIKTLARHAHQLAGAAQMFGFVELNQAAKELEQLIKKESSLNSPNFHLINELTDCLLDEINLIEQQ
ncbi:ATP-binding protein [Colwellia sp. E2M01]|uniref:tetratricopeptide repeat-containing hybrid sensor histidine kinase/response regulator n=1 Tax=Colwellia sp. E2M01 TaxID=2841561 RepID=UPI001C0967A1|nr:ATP-binding protein [Colwellia sp. E2M01]MBU2870233.1 response regulator [Colwellia sp. E2M01]